MVAQEKISDFGEVQLVPYKLKVDVECDEFDLGGFLEEAKGIVEFAQAEGAVLFQKQYFLDNGMRYLDKVRRILLLFVKLVAIMGQTSHYSIRGKNRTQKTPWENILATPVLSHVTSGLDISISGKQISCLCINYLLK